MDIVERLRELAEDIELRNAHYADTPQFMRAGSTVRETADAAPLTPMAERLLALHWQPQEVSTCGSASSQICVTYGRS